MICEETSTWPDPSFLKMWNLAPARGTSLAQQTVDILRLVEVLGGIESDRLNQPR